METKIISDETGQNQAEEEAKPFVSPCRKLDTLAPMRWLRKGWEDFKRAPGHSLTYGFVMMLSSVLISYLAWRVGSFTMVIVMMAGFIFIGPALAMGLYSISCQLEKAGRVRFFQCLRQGRKRLGNQMILAFALLIVFLVWARAASMVHIFMPATTDASLGSLIAFVLIGSAVGSLFAVVIFCSTVFAIPMIMDRDVDAVTAMLTSFNAVLKNKPAMFVWAMAIVVGMLFGFMTFFLGLMVILPIIGHATWHGYRETIVADDWPKDPDT